LGERIGGDKMSDQTIKKTIQQKWITYSREDGLKFQFGWKDFLIFIGGLLSLEHSDTALQIIQELL